MVPIRSLAVALLLFAAGAPAGQAPPTEFSRLVARLSEPGGYFQSDNLVSNETSYLHVLGTIRGQGLKGGAYLGVGPEQGFSYIAELQPAIAIMVDIRRDNLLLHLLLKAMFETARNRLEYLCYLYGRAAPADLAMWTDLPLASLLDYVSGRLPDSTVHAANHARLMERVTRYGVPLVDEDRLTLRRFHDEFMIAGLEIRYTTRNGRNWRPMPTNQDLYLATDLEGTLASYLATEDRWRRVRDLHKRNRIVPVTGDLAGPIAMPAIAKYLHEIKQPVSVFYVSNVEQYLFRQGVFGAFAANVRQLPARPNAILVRSTFGGRWIGSGGPPPGGLSRQRAQTFGRFLELAAVADSLDYWTLVNDALDARLVPATPPGSR